MAAEATTSAFSEIQPRIRRPPRSTSPSAAAAAAMSSTKDKRHTHRPQEGSSQPTVVADAFKSPQRVYEEALNFDDLVGSGVVVDGGGTDNAVALKFSRLLSAFNDSEVLYPTFVMVLSALSLVIVVFQKSVSILVKCILVVLYLVLLVTTVYTFKNRA